MLPCYNEADNLPLLLERYLRVWQDLPTELILVNNGSTDRTAEVLDRELNRPELSFARAIVVARNRGYGHGVSIGLRAARGEFVGFSHADMQCDPADVFTAYHQLVAEADPARAMVKGRRVGRRRGASLVTNAMTLLASTVLLARLTDINAQPKVFHSSHADRLTNPPDSFEFDLYVLYRARQARLTVLTIPVEFGERAHGRSKWAFSLRSRYRMMLSTMIYIFRLRFGGGK